MSYLDNPIMEWADTYSGGWQWQKVTDHGRSPLSVDWERLETKQRMANGFLRRYSVAKKRIWSLAWVNLPSVDIYPVGHALAGQPLDFLAGGHGAQWLQAWHDEHDDMFMMRLRAGSDIDSVNPLNPHDSDDPLVLGGNADGIRVMITDFSKEVTKRGRAFDLLSLNMTIEEC